MSSTQSLSDGEKHRRSQLYATLTYGGVILVFVGVCVMAVFLSMQAESNRQGFQAIEVTKPISFFDYTYVKKDKQ